VLLAFAVACGTPQTLRVTAIQIGKSLNADNTVSQTAVTFHPNDKIYLSVQTAGMGSATISVRWMYGSQLLDEPKKQVSYKDFAATDFSLQNAGSFPVGKYSAEVFFNGQSAGTKTFIVE
jgi:predicted alpha/beta hydrolase